MRLKGLGHHCHRADGAFFIDDRIYRRKAPIVAWLNCRAGRFSVNVVNRNFKIDCHIPASILDLGEAIEFVYRNSRWT